MIKTLNYVWILNSNPGFSFFFSSKEKKCIRFFFLGISYHLLTYKWESYNVTWWILLLGPFWIWGFRWQSLTSNNNLILLSNIYSFSPYYTCPPFFPFFILKRRWIVGINLFWVFSPCTYVVHEKMLVVSLGGPENLVSGLLEAVWIVIFWSFVKKKKLYYSDLIYIK